MKKITKGIIIVIAFCFIAMLTNEYIDDKKDERYYRETLYKYLVSTNDILELIVERDDSVATFSKLYHDLDNRMDRIVMFINNSDNYLDMGYQPVFFIKITHIVGSHYKNGVIDPIEIETIVVLNEELSDLIDEIGIEDEVDHSLSLSEIHERIKIFEVRLSGRGEL